MKHLLAFLFLSCAAVFNSFCAPTNQPPTSAEQLRSELETALKARDTNSIVALYNWQGVSDNMKTNETGIWFADVFEFYLKHQTNVVQISVKLLPLIPYADEPVINGFRDQPNVHLVGEMGAQLSVAANGTYSSWSTLIPYGEKNSAFYLASTVTEKISSKKTN